MRPTGLPDHPDLVVLRKAAHAVRDALRETDAARFGEHMGMGADGTPTEFVDTVAERALFASLDASKARVNVLSEEAGFVERGGDRLLVVDPVDGSTNAVRGIPVYCTSLAIAAGGDVDAVEVALVLNLPTGDEYAAVRGRGAWLNGRPLRTPGFDPDNVAIATSMGQYAKKEAMGLAAEARFNVRGLGSATLEMCLVAQGALDLYYFASERLRVTDIAASTLIVREAGGLVTDQHLGALDLPLDLKARAGVAAATRPEGLAFLRGVLERQGVLAFKSSQPGVA